MRLAFFDELRRKPMSLISTLKKIAKAAPAVLTALPTIVSAVKEVKGALKTHPKPSTAPATDSATGAGPGTNPTG
jgi:hypothetical protein